MNLNSETRNGYTISSDMKKVWNIQKKLGWEPEKENMNDLEF